MAPARPVRPSPDDRLFRWPQRARLQRRVVQAAQGQPARQRPRLHQSHRLRRLGAQQALEHRHRDAQGPRRQRRHRHRRRAWPRLGRLSHARRARPRQAALGQRGPLRRASRLQRDGAQHQSQLRRRPRHRHRLLAHHQRHVRQPSLRRHRPHQIQSALVRPLRRHALRLGHGAHRAVHRSPAGSISTPPQASSPRIPPARMAATSRCARPAAKTSASSSRPSRPSPPRQPASPSPASPVASCISGPPTSPPAIPRSGS